LFPVAGARPSEDHDRLRLATEVTSPNGDEDRPEASLETRLQIESRSMSDNNIDVTNSSGDQDYGQNVHWRIVSGMVADLVGDCERSRRQHEMGQDSHPALGEHEIGQYRKDEANDGNKIVHSTHFGGPTLSAGLDRHISRFPMLDSNPKLLSKTSLRRLNGKKVRLFASHRLDIDPSGLIPT
jgi:hypothetical protein